jgi:hypothetical protein
MENRILEYAIEKRTDPAAYAERALASANDAQCPPEIRARITAKIAEHRARTGAPASANTSTVFIENITPEQARVKALLASLV